MGITWDFDPSQIKDDIDKEINKKINQFLTECYNNLVALSPVDTGRYRNAHHFSINAPSYAESGATSIRIPVGDYPQFTYKTTCRMPVLLSMADIQALSNMAHGAKTRKCMKCVQWADIAIKRHRGFIKWRLNRQ